MRARPAVILALALGAALASALAGGRASAGASCRPTLAAELATTGRASELITVVAGAANATAGSLELWQRAGGCWRPAGGPWPAALGWNGVSAHHVEGDGTTPEGAYGIGPVMYGVAPDPGVRFRYRRLVCGDWWDEDSSSPAYNQFVALRCGEQPGFGGDSEALWRATTAYAYFALIDYNTDPVVPGAGSAIFLHVSGGGPTDGCVALPSAELVRVLRWLRPSLSPLIVIGTSAAIRSY